MSSHQVRTGFLTLILLLSFHGLASADSVQGRVIDATRTGLDMTVYDADGRPYPNALHINIDRRTQMNGILSPAQLRRADVVLADVSKDSDGTWVANSVSRLSESAAAQTPVSAPSPSLMSSLTGQKIIRNGLLGAATGAIASGSSGGKAGKGALIGAGVGIAGGLLEDMFSSHSQPQQEPVSVDSRDDRN